MAFGELGTIINGKLGTIKIGDTFFEGAVFSLL